MSPVSYENDGRRSTVAYELSIEMNFRDDFVK